MYTQMAKRRGTSAPTPHFPLVSQFHDAHLVEQVSVARTRKWIYPTLCLPYTSPLLPSPSDISETCHRSTVPTDSYHYKRRQNGGVHNYTEGLPGSNVGEFAISAVGDVKSVLHDASIALCNVSPPVQTNEIGISKGSRKDAHADVLKAHRPIEVDTAVAVVSEFWEVWRSFALI